jgi:uncharacterized protein (DUF2225 family)
MIAKVFGMGHASKTRPSALLEQSKRMYNTISEEIAKLKGEEVPAAKDETSE